MRANFQRRQMISGVESDSRAIPHYPHESLLDRIALPFQGFMSERFSIARPTEPEG
jgi:hypothetical protein